MHKPAQVAEMPESDSKVLLLKHACVCVCVCVYNWNIFCNFHINEQSIQIRTLDCASRCSWNMQLKSQQNRIEYYEDFLKGKFERETETEVNSCPK